MSASCDLFAQYVTGCFSHDYIFCRWHLECRKDFTVPFCCSTFLLWMLWNILKYWCLQIILNCTDLVQWETTLLLQRDLNALYEWTQVNHLLLNVNKCAFISFYKINERVDSNYQIDHVNLVRVKVVKDLGVWFDEKLNFVEHVSRISISGTRMLGFIMRHSSSFSLGTMRVLYCTLVRSTVEYSTTVWSPLYAVHSSVIERIQNKFLRYTAYNMKINMTEYHRSAMLKLLNLSTLHDRRIMFDAFFLFKLLRGITD